MKVLFVVQEGPDSGITIYAHSVAKALKKLGVQVAIDEKYFSNYDIIHIHGRPHLGALFAKVKNYAPIVATTHVTKKEFEGLVPDHFLWAADAYLKTLYRISKKIFVTAPYLMKELGKKKEIKDKLVFSAYTVDLDRFSNRKDIGKNFLRQKFNLDNSKQIILSVASIQKRKGIFDFIETAKKLPKYEFVWVGKVPSIPSLKHRKKIDSVMGGDKPNNVTFAGPLFGDNLVKAFYSADLFWHPSHSETFGLVIVEAAASGLPVLVRELSVYKQFSDFVTMFKSNPEEKIVALLTNNKKRQKAINSAKKAVQRYDLDKHAKLLLSEYEKVIGTHMPTLVKKYSAHRKPIISVIVPTLNEEKYIEKTLSALQKQSVPKSFYEIIVSDSSSTDKTVSIAKKFADKVVVCKKISAGHGRNFGAKIAKGKYLGFVDADTIVAHNWVEGLIEGLEKGVACSGPIDSLEKDSKRLNAFFKMWDAQTKTSIGIKYPIIPGFNFGARRKDFFAVKGFSEKNIVVEDMDLSLKLSKKGRVVYSKKMSVKSSTRRLKEIPVIEYMLNATQFVMTGKSWGWEKHRKDFKDGK